MKKTYIYYSEDIEKSGWDRYVLDGAYHDMSFLFDGDKVYFIYDVGDIKIIELEDDLSGVKEGGIHHLLFSTPSKNMRLRCEGCRAYKLNGYYYLLFIEWPNGKQKKTRCMLPFEKSFGKYERKILLTTTWDIKSGIAQGL